MKNSKRLFSYFFLFGIITGIIIGEKYLKSLQLESGIYGEYFFEKIISEKIISEKYLFFIAGERIKLFIIIYILSRLRNVKAAGALIFTLLGMNMGTGLDMAVGKYHAYGVILFAASVLPHWIIYYNLIIKILDEKFDKAKDGIRCIIYFILAVLTESIISIELLRLAWKIH